MSNNVRLSRGLVSRAIGISALIAILFVLGCSTNGGNFAVVTTSSQLTAAVVNTAYAGATLTASHGTAPYTWTATTGALPPGMSLSSAGAISGTPTQSGAFNFTVQAKDSATPTAHTATASLTLNVNQVPAITSATSTTFTAGASGTFTVTATGFPAPTFTETGALPAGVTLTAASGVLAGTAGAGTGGTYPITITAQNGVTPNATQSFTLTVNQAPAITSQVSAGFAAGVQSTFTVTVTGFPAPTLSETGALPTGVTFNASTGVLSGSTSAQGSYPVVFTAANGIGSNASQNFTLVVGLAPAITSGNSTTFTVGTPGTFTVTASGSPASTFSETGALPSGVTLNATTGLLSGTPAVGTGGSYSLTITAQNTVPPNATQSFTLTVNEAPAITSNNNATFTLSSNGTFKVTSSGNPTATLTETGSLPSAVTFVDNHDGTATISGIPATGTAGAYPITITALNGIGAGASQSFTLTVSAAIPCGSGSESLLNGQYTFALRGFDAIGPVSVGGIFNADGTGKVATLVGVEDINSTSSSGVQNLSINSAGSSYKVGSDHRGCLTIHTSAGTQIFRFSLGGISSGVASIGHIVEFDATGSNTAGVLRLQTSAPFSTSSISGNYAFGASGPDVPSGKFAIVGMLNLSGGSVVTTGANPSVIDTNDKGNINLTGGSVYPTTPIALNAGGTYSIASNGRGTLSLIVSAGSSSTVHVIVYAVSTQEFLILPGDVQSQNGLFVGSAMLQSGAPFSTSSLNGNSILYTTGLGTNGSTTVSRVSAGILSANSGTFTFSGQQNNGGTLQAQSVTGGTATVGGNGRVTVAGGGGGSAPIIYLAKANKGFVLFADTSTTSAHVESGFLEPQTGGPFSAASANGTYAFGSIQPDDVTLSVESGVATFNGITTQVSGTSDNNSSGTLNPGNTFGPVSYSVDSTGLGLIPAGCSIDGTTGQNGTCQNFFYMISPTRAVVVDATSSTTPVDPHLEVADQ
jgi:hypothetical protein